jgi:4-amino-4-deoxy-L-arabinose transferase-like glycosyltransferase
LSRFRNSPLAALGVILLVLGLLWTRTKVQPLSSFDQPFYVGIAYDLVHHGRFTDGYFFAQPGADVERPSSMRFTPLYPILLASAAEVEPAFRAAMDCLIAAGPTDQDRGCPRAATLPRSAQFLMLAGFYLLLWWVAGVIGGSRRAAWIALALGLVPAQFLLISVNYLMTEMTSLLLSLAATAAVLAAWRGDRPRRFLALAGVLLGLLALTRPAFLYLFLASTLSAAVLIAIGRAGPRARAAALLAMFVLGFAVPVAPWVARNAIVLGRPALTHGYDSHTLVQRISFDSMTWREYALSYVCWLPDGNGLGQKLAGPGACDRFFWDDKPNSFYAIGIGPLMQQTVEAAGGWDNHLRYLLTHYILREPVWHALVTIPLALRGAWIDHYWGLLLGITCAVLTLGAARRRDVPFLILAGPAWFMLLFNAAVAVNQPRYNLMLVPPYAVAGALVLDRRLARRAAFSSPALGTT